MRLLDVRSAPRFAFAPAPALAFAPAFALAFGAAAGCGGSSAQPGGAESASPEAPDASSSPDDAGVEAACASGALPLVVTMQSTPLGRTPLALFVPATYEGSPALFVLDTGSPYTFLHQPLPDGGGDGGNDAAPGSDMMLTPDAGSIRLGCDTMTIPGIDVVDTPPVDGKPVVGTLGGDRLFTRPLLLDVSAHRAVWGAADTPFAQAAGWPSAPFERQLGYVRLRDVAFDGTPVQLIVDTGAPDSLWLGQGPQPGDDVVEGVDSDGHVVKLYRGTVTLTMGSAQKKVPVLRAPSFPYVQAVADALGGHVDGLLGLSAFAKGIVFDIDAALVRVEP
jgi:hypothetical protein